MRKLKFISTFILIVLSVIACRPTISEEKMAEIDSLQKVLEAVQIKVATIDSSTGFAMADDYEEKLYFFQAEIKDTLPRAEAVFVDEWYRMRKAMRNFSSNYSLISNELSINIQQLNDLRYDAENGLLEEEQFKDYIALEKDNVDNVAHAAKELVENYEWVKPEYEKKLPRIDSLIKAYKEIENIE